MIITPRLRLLSTVFLSSAFLAAMPSIAQEMAGGSGIAPVPAVAAPGPGSEIVVTGTRLTNPNLSSASPVTVVSGQELKLEGTTRVEDLINSLPQAVAGQGSAISNGASGTATVNLRNLGPSRTLVLVNGRRLAPGDVYAPFADLNQIPAALVKRVDVLTGGASSVYGSDAVAGVVNFVMDNDFTGFRVDGQYSFYNHDNNNKIANSVFADPARSLGFSHPGGTTSVGGTRNVSVTAGAGTPDGRGHITAYATYRRINAVTQGDYDYSACTLQAVGDDLNCSGSPVTSPAQFYLNGGTGSKVTLNKATGNTFRPITDSDVYNFGPSNYFQRPDTRYTLGAFAHYDVSSAFKPYLEVMYMNDRSTSQLAASGMFGEIFSLSCDNPMLSPSELSAVCGAQAGNGSASSTLSILRRNVEGGPRQDAQQHSSYRIVVGAKGAIAPGWSYDAYAELGRTDYSEHFKNDVSFSRTQQALDVVSNNGVLECADAAARDAGCTPYNIFAIGGVTQAALNYIQQPALQQGYTKEYVASASLSGDLGVYGVKSPWADDAVSVAIGAEYRKDSTALSTDAEYESGDLMGQGGPLQSFQGSYDVKEEFAEVGIPLVSGRPFINQLGLSAGFRHSDYSTAGKTNSFKVEGIYAPVEAIKVRGGFNRAVRAPNLRDLYAPQVVQLFQGDDPCAGEAVGGLVNGFTAAQCARSGVTGAEFGHIAGNSADQLNELAGGTLALKPERSDTITAGVVLAPRMGPLRGLNASVDFYDIKVKNLISDVGSDLILSQCVNTGNPEFCNLVHRDPSNGSLWLGKLGRVDNLNRNIGGLRTRGIDVTANYRLKLADVGLPDWASLDFNFDGTYTLAYRISPGLVVGGATSYSCKGYFGGECITGNDAATGPIPAWKHKLRVTWDGPDGLQLSMNWRHTSSVRLDETSSSPFLNDVKAPAADSHIKAYDWFDLALAVNITDKYTFRIGADNVFDRDPPLIGLSQLPSIYGNGNTLPQSYDALGRYIYASVTVNF